MTMPLPNETGPRAVTRDGLGVAGKASSLAHRAAHALRHLAPGAASTTERPR
ncbi:hypothetical protein NF681_19395 (plasmid) [Comamonadaceae bacterium OTU4NAUVB1]|jgi:hypothetical protein|nr:hypothetical protein NF681_19395 [Comamonadaceae bacterium OTU4NAUVB1]